MSPKSYNFPHGTHSWNFSKSQLISSMHATRRSNLLTRILDADHIHRHPLRHPLAWEDQGLVTLAAELSGDRKDGILSNLRSGAHHILFQTPKPHESARTPSKV